MSHGTGLTNDDHAAYDQAISKQANPKQESYAMRSTDNYDLIILKMSQYFMRRARGKSYQVPDELSLIHMKEKNPEEWGDLIHDLINEAHPFTDEDGTWTTTHMGKEVTHTIGSDEVMAAARYARTMLEMANRGDYALLHLMSDALNKALDDLYKKGQEDARTALAAEQGLI